VAALSGCNFAAADLPGGQSRRRLPPRTGLCPRV